MLLAEFSELNPFTAHSGVCRLLLRSATLRSNDVVLFTETVWSDLTSLVDVTTDQCAGRLNSKRSSTNSIRLTSPGWISPTRQFEIESKTLENWIRGDYWNSPTYRELQSNSYSNAFFFLFFLFRLSFERLNIWREPLFPEWLEDSCLLQSCRHTALWHSLLSRLRAMWHRASLIRSQWTSLPLRSVKGMQIAFHGC